MSNRLPLITYVLGLAGLLPFVGCALGALSVGPWQMQSFAALMAYSALILAFLGGVHWGLVMSPPPATPSDAVPRTLARIRLILGVLPSLIGWAGLLLSSMDLPDLGLALMTAGFVGTVFTERHWAGLGLVPPAYMRLRWVLSLLVVMILLTVLGFRLVGVTIDVSHASVLSIFNF